MELIIFIIVMLIISSLFRYLKGETQDAQKDSSIGIQTFDSASHEEGKGQAAARSRAEERKKGPAVSPASSKAPPKARPVRGKKNEYVAAKDSRGMERELEVLLKGKGLPLGIVALEVLSPPRAKRPYSRN